MSALELLAGDRGPDAADRLDSLAAALAAAVDAKGDYRPSHSQAVARVATALGAQLGIRGTGLVRLRRAGLMHDVGKLQTPDAILLKPGRLASAEYEVIKLHAIAGHTLIAGLGMADEARWVLHHHERADGGGYPSGLAGTAIPLPSRILQVADAFDCMTSTRCYQPARTASWALGELREHAGSQFDPAVVDALQASVRSVFPRPA